MESFNPKKNSEKIKNFFEKTGRYVRKQAFIITVSFGSLAIAGCHEDYTSYGTFNKAFSEARKDGLEKFEWNGNVYTTKLADSKLSDIYHDSFEFLNNYYSSNAYKEKLLSSEDTLDVKESIVDSIYNSMVPKYEALDNVEDPVEWYEKYLILKKENPRFEYEIKEKYDSLGYPGLSKKLDELKNSKQKKVLDNLNEKIYTSITSQKGNLSENGSFTISNNKKKIFIYGIGDRDLTTPVHELTHKSTNGNFDLNTKIVDIVNMLIDNVNRNKREIYPKFNYNIEFMQYLLNPTEIDARQNSTRYWLYKNCTGYSHEKVFTRYEYDFLIKNKDKLPYDIIQLIDIISNPDIFIKNMNYF